MCFFNYEKIFEKMCNFLKTLLTYFDEREHFLNKNTF